MRVDVGGAPAASPLPVRVAALLHDLGKAATPPAERPSHPRARCARSVPLVEQFCARLRVPNAQRDLALAVTRDHLLVHRVRELRAGTLLDMLERLGAFKRGEFFDQALDACLCDARGRLGQENCEYPPVAYLRAAREAAAAIQAGEVVKDGFSGVAVGEELKQRRTQRLQAFRQYHGERAA